MNFGGDHFGGYQSMNTSSFGGGMAGGGFMDDSSPTMDSSQPTKEKTDAIPLIPCTVAMLHSADYDDRKDTFMFEGIELHKVKLVGIIREIEEMATNIVYKVNDMTGPSILSRKWLEADESQEDRKRRSSCRENTYVRVFGSLKHFENQATVIVFSIQPLTDFNEISYHMLDVVHSYLASVKRKEMAFSPKRDMTRTPSTVTPGRGGMGSSFGGGSNEYGGGGSRPSFGGGNDGVGGLEKQILNAISTCTAVEGLTVADLKQKFRHVNEAQIKKSVLFLNNEGHIYSTIDEDHFRATAEG